MQQIEYGAPVLRVRDLQRSLAYYRDRLGFTVEFEYQGFYAGVAREGCRLHLKCADPLPRDAARVAAEEHIDVCLGVQGVDALARAATAAGATIALPLRAMPYGREFYVADPDGYVLGFIEVLPA